MTFLIRYGHHWACNYLMSLDTEITGAYPHHHNAFDDFEADEFVTLSGIYVTPDHIYGHVD